MKSQVLCGVFIKMNAMQVQKVINYCDKTKCLSVMLSGLMNTQGVFIREAAKKTFLNGRAIKRGEGGGKGRAIKEKITF